MTHDLLRRYQPLADAVAALLYPHAEVVLHDLTTLTIAYIANNLSRRGIGDESAVDDLTFEDGEQWIGPYDKVNWDGGRMRSVSLVHRDAGGTPTGLVCINMNLSAFEAARSALTLLLENPALKPQPDSLFRDDWQERINAFLKDWLTHRGLTLAALSRPQKRDLIAALEAHGAFRGRSAAPYVAQVLGLSRGTVFNHLRALRGEPSGLRPPNGD
jgi:predicted transcriptional regulator YheO